MRIAIRELALAVFLSLSSAALADGQAPRCVDLDRNSRLTFDLTDADLRWVSSAFWVQRRELVLLDNASNQLVKASLDRRPSRVELVGRAPAVDSGKGSEYFKYASPLPDMDGFVMFTYRHEARSGDLVEVGPDFKRRRAVRLETLGDGALKVSMIYRFAPLGDGVLAYADLATGTPGKQEHFHSFLLVNFDGSYELLGGPVPGESPLHFRSVRDVPFITSLDDTGYVLVLEDEAWVARVSWDQPRLARLGLDAEVRAKYSKLVELEGAGDPKVSRDTWGAPHRLKMERVYRFYRDVESSTILAGIHTWQGRLFLLAREALDDKTRWGLLEIDEETGKLKRRYVLPTQAMNVLLAPGEDFLVLIEKDATRKTSSPELKLTREALAVQWIHRSFLSRPTSSLSAADGQHVALSNRP